MSKSEREHPAYEYGTDKQFLDFVSYQPSVIDGTYHQELNGIGRNIPCHVRRINKGAGMGIKPPFSAVSLTNQQHNIQSNLGERNCLFACGALRLTEDQAREWFERKADEMLSKWIESIINKRRKA